ncbi:glycosyltransferase family 2 protein [Phaeovulum sp.]|uniref:glycosyltransferase family 2 protein n=1 Tax=Phaeovulum sp. TaxID=2934796 RepID=UPI0039E3705E
MTDHPQQKTPPPLVTVIMANFRGAQHIEAAMHAVLRQSHEQIELIVSDDASDDDSYAIVTHIAATDPRVRLITAQTRGGPARARNGALAVARGEWIAIVDADDLVHPERIMRMLDAAAALGADMVADDMMPFGNLAATAQGTLYGATLAQGPRTITAADMIASPPLGYLKPLIRRTTLGALRYDESLHNGEDFDLYLRLLLKGARLVLLPQPTYLYRRHASSTSHRLSAGVLQPLLAAHDRLTPTSPEIAALLGRRRKGLVRSLRYARLVDAVKARNRVGALWLLLKHPVLVADLAESLRDRRRRHAATPADTAPPTGPIVLAAPDDARLAQGSLAKATLIAVGRAPSDGQYPDDTALAAQLCRLHAYAAPDVTAIGLTGLRGLGYLPGWHSLSVLLTPEEAAIAGALLPKDITPVIAPYPATSKSSR